MSKTTADSSATTHPHENKTASGIKGTATETNPAEGQRTAMETLPSGHTYRDRVEAQAKALNVKIEDGWTLERLLFEIRMQASS